MMKSIFSVAGVFAATTVAYTQPGANTYGALLTPNGDNPVITGQTTQITWTPKTPTDGVTVSLVLCNGPSTNCVRQSGAIVEGVPASAASYAWNVPCDFPTGTANTASGYGMLIIVDGTGEFQYSTQFSVVRGPSCGASGSTSTSSVSSPISSVSHMSSAAHTDHGSTWMAWSSSSTTFNTSTIPSTVPSTIASTALTAVSVSTSQFSYAPAATTSAASVSYAYPSSSQTTAVGTQATATTARPSAFTGAAVAPVVNVLGLVGAAGLAVLAL